MDDDEAALAELHYANELEHQREQEMLKADPAWTEFLNTVENEHAESL